MRLSLFFRIFAIIALLASVFGPSGASFVLANAPGEPGHSPAQIIAEPNCFGLDIVFLVSQSTIANINDTFKLRMEGVRTAIDLLGENILFFCPGYTHRISVIGFAQPQGAGSAPITETYVPIPGKDGSDLIQPSLSNIAAWQDREKNELKNALPIKDIGYYSHYQSAFEAAAAQLKNWSDHPVNQQPRRRAAIVIGEGGLCTAELLCNGYSQVAAGLNKLTDPNGSSFPFKGVDNPQSVAIYMLGILPRRVAAYQFLEDAPVNSFWTNLTTSHGGQLIILSRGQGDLERNLNTDLALKLAKLMDNLLGSRLFSNNCQPLWVNPYTSTLTTLHLFRKNAAGQNGTDNVAVSIRGAQGNTVVAEYANGQVKSGTGKVLDYASPANEKYALYQTPPGLYTITVSGGDFCQDIELQVGQTGATAKVLNLEQNARFPQIDQAPYYDAANPFRFRVQLFQPDLQGNESPLKEINEYPLTPKLAIRAQVPGMPNTVSFTYQLNRVDDANAIYETKDPIVLRYPGTYSWSLSVDTLNPRRNEPLHPDASPLTVVKKDGVFTVGAVTKAFSFVIQDFQNNQQLPLVDGALSAPLEITAQVVNPDLTPFRVDQTVTPKGTSPFEAAVKLPNGQVISKELKPTNKNNIYSAQLSLQDDRPASYDPGCYTIRVKLKDNFDQSVFIPQKTESEPVSVCLVTAQKFAWTVINPGSGEEYPLHPRLSTSAAPAKLPIIIQAFDTSKRQINAADMQTNDKAVFAGVIIEPGIAKGFPLTFRPDPETGNFIADWPEEANREGLYTLRVSLETENLKLGYFSPVNRLDPIEFVRKDDFLSKPWALPVIGAILGVIILLLALIAFLNSMRSNRARGIQKI